MPTYLRYALATICIALSVACLGLWGRNVVRNEALDGITICLSSISLNLETYSGTTAVWVESGSPTDSMLRWKSNRISDIAQALFFDITSEHGSIGQSGDAVYFPLWFAALVFALAGVGALRLSRRFTLSSAIIATTVVAGLLGMAVAL